MSTPSAQPAARTSVNAARIRAIGSANDSFTATMTWSAPTAPAAIRAPSMIRYGLRTIRVRSLKLPGSPSAPLTTTVPARSALAATVRHFVPVGNPAPPRPRSPDASSSSIVAVGPRARAASSPAPPPAAT